MPRPSCLEAGFSERIKDGLAFDAIQVVVERFSGVALVASSNIGASEASCRSSTPIRSSRQSAVALSRIFSSSRTLPEEECLLKRLHNASFAVIASVMRRFRREPGCLPGVRATAASSVR